MRRGVSVSARALARLGTAAMLALGCLTALPSAAGAEASVGPVPLPGPTGLPDGRIYEQVSPAYKSGNFYDSVAGFSFGLARADGDAVLYPMSGAVGTAYAGALTDYVSTRTPGSGWQTQAATPRPDSTDFSAFSGTTTMIPSMDFNRFVFTSELAYAAAEPKHEYGIEATSGVNIFLSEDPGVEAQWIGEPKIAQPIPHTGDVQLSSYVVAGAGPELETVYFTYAGTLTPEDQAPAGASRAENVTDEGQRKDDPWGFYEWTGGKLVSAGVLPDGTLSPFGAVPAAIANETDEERQHHETQADGIDNEVSADGDRAFFVSPDPAASLVTDRVACEAEPPCSSQAPELYVREPAAGGGKQSVLISASQLTGHEGEAAPDGVLGFADTPKELNGGTDAFASPDGSHVFFESIDQLTAEAPANAEAKMYDYDLETGALTYLPALTGPLGLVSSNGSEVLFENRTANPWQLELWHDGVGGGSATPVAEMVGDGNLSAVHVSEDGEVFVFRTNAAIPGFNDVGGFEQIYRYDAAADELSCVSCPPSGVAPNGEARMSYNNSETGVKGNGTNSDPVTTIETRGMSSDGSRVFFDTTSALVPQDTNGIRDVYEWENGTVDLISSGSGTEGSEYLDNDATGENVFFATPDGLVPGDTDEADDIYDARIPRPGDNPPPAQTPCKGSICQGPPSVPQLLGAPASETFNGAGNLVPEGETQSKQKAKSRAKAKGKGKQKAKGKSRKAKGKSHRKRKRKHARGHEVRAGKSTGRMHRSDNGKQLKDRNRRGK